MSLKLQGVLHDIACIIWESVMLVQKFWNRWLFTEVIFPINGRMDIHSILQSTDTPMSPTSLKGQLLSLVSGSVTDWQMYSSLFSGQHVECNCFCHTGPFLGSFFVWGSMKNAHEIDCLKVLMAVAFGQFTLECWTQRKIGFQYYPCSICQY
jgi:hypothetical protein